MAIIKKEICLLVFCYISNFKNSNSFHFGKESLDEEFDALYLTIKLANNLRWIDNKETMVLESIKKAHFENKDMKKEKVSKEETRPIFITDGWVSTDIIKTLSTNLPNNIFFYPSPITAIAKSVLSTYLNVPCKAINEILVWAANDEVFYVEVEKPLINDDTVDLKSKCDWDMVGEDLLKTFNLDSTQLSAFLMRKEFIEKLIPYCKKFFQENIIDRSCAEDNSGTIFFNQAA